MPQPLQGVKGVVWLSSRQGGIYVACYKTWLPCDSQLDHSQSVLKARMGRVALKRLGGYGGDQYLIKRQPGDGCPGDRNVTRMRRVEGTPEKSYAHRASYRARGILGPIRMTIAYIALGSNLADRRAMLATGVHCLERLGSIVARSSLYETEPVGFRDQAAFLNAVIALRTQLEPPQLLHALLAIERELGRDRTQGVPKGPRTLDLDLLLMGDTVTGEAELTLPHPALASRRFVLAPLAEIAPALQHPIHQRTIAELLALLPDEGENRISAVCRLDGRSEPQWQGFGELV
jgi:2-amino-4-hydroxy-6-hydroxymethyldihydropteridine diphosphokinase